jgi:ABC-type sugar transport system ATPase subunit
MTCSGARDDQDLGEETVTDSMSTAISISGLVKTFGPTRALDGLDLTVATGEVHGFLGPNGAGKTTTIRSLVSQPPTLEELFLRHYQTEPSATTDDDREGVS